MISVQATACTENQWFPYTRARNLTIRTFDVAEIRDMFQFITFASFGTLAQSFSTLGQNVLEEDLDAEPDQHQPADDFRLLAQ